MPKVRLVGTVLVMALVLGLGSGLLSSLARKHLAAGPPAKAPSGSPSPRGSSTPPVDPSRPTSSPTPVSPVAPSSTDDVTADPNPTQEPGGPGTPGGPGDPPGSGAGPETPTSFVDVRFGDDESGVALSTEVPADWKTVTYQDEPLQRDWVDPTRNLRLKVRGLLSTATTDAEAQANAHIDEQSRVLSDFKVTHRAWTDLETEQTEVAQPVPAYELTYAFTDADTGRTRYAAARFIGESGDVMISVMLWRGQFDEARPALERATANLAGPA